MELKGTKTEKNLMEAFKGESQARNKYDYYASRARKDGYEQIAEIFEETAKRKWIIYEIEKAWNEGKGLFGVYIHNIPDPVTGKCKKGENPFLRFKMNRDGKTLRSVIKCYDPEPKDAYNCIFEHIEDWVADAESIRDFY